MSCLARGLHLRCPNPGTVTRQVIQQCYFLFLLVKEIVLSLKVTCRSKDLSSDSNPSRPLSLWFSACAPSDTWDLKGIGGEEKGQSVDLLEMWGFGVLVFKP